MRQGYFGFLREASSAEDLGGYFFGESNLAFPFPLFLTLEVLYTMVHWIACASEVLPGLDEFLEGLLDPVFKIDFYFEELSQESETRNQSHC